MQYQLPQFIEVEDKIIGPFTFKQFVYLAGGAGLSYIAYAIPHDIFSLPFLISIIPPIPIALLALALAFYKVNNRPFIFALESAIKFYFGKKLYIWKKQEPVVTARTLTQQTANSGITLPTLSESKLKDLSWNLDIKDAQTVSEAEKLNETAHLYAKKTSMTAPERPVDASAQYKYQHANNKPNTSVHTD